MAVFPNIFTLVPVLEIDREAMIWGLISAGFDDVIASDRVRALPDSDGALQMLARHRAKGQANGLIRGFKHGWNAALGAPGGAVELDCRDAAFVGYVTDRQLAMLNEAHPETEASA